MKIDLNDPRLTAYALGELDAAERAEVETLLKGDETARREVETIRRAASTLTGELQSEPCPKLAPEQVAKIRERFAPTMKEATSFAWWRLLGWATTLGVATLMAAMFLPALNQARGKGRRLPVNTPSERQATLRETPTAEQAPSLAYAVPQGMRAITISPGEVTAAGSVVKPGDRVDILDTYRDPVTKTETTRIAMQDVPVLGVNNGQLVLGAESEEAKSFMAADRAGTLHVAVRPAQDQTIVTSARDSSGMRSFEVAMKPPGSPITVTRPEASVRLYTPTGNGGQLPLYQQDHEDIKQPARGGVELFRNGQPTDGITIYRGKEGRTVPFDGINAESYPRLVENPFVATSQNPLSTFGLDVDTASYANIRRFLNQGSLPPRDAVRIEEMLNYFSYDYPAPKRNEPFALYVEMAACPWNAAHRLALIGLKTKDVAPRKTQPMNLVFLIDVSGSMQPENKLPLIKEALRLLVQQLTARDRVAIVVYADNSRVVLPSTRGDDKETILAAIDNLEAGGSTNGGAGIQSAYREASGNFIEGGVNRVILCTDGDFNVGVTDQSDLVKLIQQQAKSGVFLSVLGFGMGNLKDSTMQKLADKGNGNYAYVDDLDEARKVLVDQMRSTLVTVAKDVKMQIEFNPAHVQSYRLIGYEKRMLRAQDFNNDRKDAGEVGAGHTITALYEVVPAGSPTANGVDALRYQPTSRVAANEELMTVKLRFKEPDAATSQLLTAPVKDTGTSWRGTSSDFRFAASVAAFGSILRDSPYKGAANYDLVLQLAEGARGRDNNGYRSEFISLVNRARTLSGGNVAPDEP